MAPPPRFVTYLGARVCVPELARRAGVSVECMGWRTKNWPQSKWLAGKRENKLLSMAEASEVGEMMRRGEDAKAVAALYGISLKRAYGLKNGWRKT